ncbi:MAG: chloride channel protein [Bacteroidales bacterium]
MYFYGEMQKKTIISKFLIWVISNIRHRQMLLSLSLIIGLVSGLAAVVLKNTVYYTSAFLSGRLALETNNLIYLAFPLFGIFLSVLFVRKFIKDNISHGVSKVLHAISRKDSKLASHNSYSSMVASTFTVGFGGSVGLEAPIVLTGASIGSNLGSFLKLDYRTITLLIACGATGAIAGIFKSPIAAMIFSLEVLMLDLTMWSIIPLLISAVTGATVATLLLGQGAVFYFTLHEPFLIENIPWYILLGVIAGLVSFYFTWCSMKVETRMQNISSPYHRLFYGGAILGLLIFLFPPLYGEGYGTLRSLLGGDAAEIATGSLISGLRHNYWIFIGFLILILIFKVIAMAITTGSGGVGGIFAPSLYMGGVTGFIVARLINYFPFINVSERNFALVGMAGLMAGVMHAPLTAIFLIAEITGGYELFIPLIITSTIAYLTIMYFEPHSIYTKRLAARGELITHHKDKAVLTLMRMGPVIETDLRTVHPDESLGELVKIVSASKRNIFPVVDKENNLMGIVLLDNIRDIIFKPAQYDKIIVRDIMIIPHATVSSDENMESVMKKFEDTGAWNLPVLDDKKYVGFISKSKIFSAYRKILVQFSSE